MSYRSRKLLQTGQGKRAEADAHAALRPMVAPTVDSGPVNSLGFSIPIPSIRQADIQEGLGDITSRLNRALSQYANVYDDDEVSEDVDWATEGQAVSRRVGVQDERKEFQARYESITARVEAMERERTELMNSMAEWLEAEPVQWIPTPDSQATTDDSEPSRASFGDQLLNTKMEFEKLRHMNHEKERLGSQGQDTELLQEESSKLQMKVITKFKKLYETRKLAATRRTFGAHWKHASDEIVGLLRRIRSEGTDHIDALEDEIEKAMTAIQRQAEEMIRLEGKIREKEEMVEKWSTENAKLTNDNLLLNSEKEKCRDIIRKLKKALIEERRKRGTPTTDEDVENIGEGKVTQKLEEKVPQQKDQLGARRAPAGRDVKGERVICRLCRRRIEGGAEMGRSEQAEAKATERSDEAELVERQALADDVIPGDLETLQEENNWLTARVNQLEQRLIEKETQMMKLEFQLSELMEAVKTSSPQMIETLSMTDPVSAKGVNRAGRDKQAPGTKQMEERPSGGGTDGRESSFVASSKPAAGRKTSSLTVPRVTKPSSKQSAKRRTGEQQPIKQQSQSNLTQAAGASPQRKERRDYAAEILQLTEERDKVQGELVTLKGQLMRAQRELVTLKYASSAPASMGPRGGPLQGPEENGGEHRHDVPGRSKEGSGVSLSTTQIPSKTTTAQETPAKPKPQAVVKYDDEFQAYAELMRKDQDSRPARKMSRPCQKPKDTGRGKQDKRDQSQAKEGEEEQAKDLVQMEEYLTFDQGMQTDPQMDPLGQWSYVPSLKKRRKIDPLPVLTTRSSTDTPSDKAPIAQPPIEWTHFDPTGPITPMADHKRASISRQMRAGEEPATVDTGGIVEFVERELGRIVQGINGFTGYLKRLIQREVADVIVANQDIRRRLSEATLRKLDQGNKDSAHPSADGGRRSRALATPIRRGRFEVMKDNRPSKFAAKNAYASLQSGERRFFHSASPIPSWNIHSKIPSPSYADYIGPWSTFARDHIAMADEAATQRTLASPHDTVCVRLQRQIEMIGHHAIDVLKGTVVFFKETFTRQIEEYNTIHGAFGIRQELKTLMAPSVTPSENRDGITDSRKEVAEAEATSDRAEVPSLEPPLKLTRSISHNSFLEFRNVNYVQDNRRVDFKTSPKEYPLQTQSLSSIQSSHRYLPALSLYEKQKPRNRYEVELPKATLPRRGLVTLEVKDAVANMAAKGVDTKRRSRPVAISHRGLLARQREILAKQGTTPQDARKQGTDHLTTTLELKQHILQLQANQLYQNTEQNSLPTVELEADNRKNLPPLDNERRRIIIHAQDQLRGTVQLWDKYAGLLSDGRSPE
ncbi:uncharacterized protein LOC110986028 [Acanthaster planci]|uniref:Uncharacterized protein LOC110986028 n=1 Tax=Acanthaster planci TaxID=133434 RepID=A0A8B7ZCA9_ACAPL|nr:uncharacterized protein LOC110986028 [Acanthaster planci]